MKKAYWAFTGYMLLAVALTWPLILRLGTSVYGPYDHATTDLFGNINIHFWSLLKPSMFAAPFGAPVNLTNLTGYVCLPITALFGAVASRNIVILLNLAVSGIGMYALVRYITGSTAAAFISGIIFAFCPNMLVRSYTTFDSTQVQWIPLYTLYFLKFMEDRTWRSIILTGVFLICNILFSMPYYLVFLPILTVILFIGCGGWRSGRGYGRAIIVVAGVFVVFLIYFNTVTGGNEYADSLHRPESDLAELSLSPSDYFVPHPRNLHGSKLTWETCRPGKDPDSYVAYIGYFALLFAFFGMLGDNRYLWMLLFVILFAFISTLGPSLFGIPTPSGLIHRLYAPFARRILLYKVFVQLGVAVLAGMGISLFLREMADPIMRHITIVALMAGIIIEYALVPPALSVDLTRTPELYQQVKSLPENTVLLELPMRRNNGNIYQGYAYYQTLHNKPIVNSYFGFKSVPGLVRRFYEAIERDPNIVSQRQVLSNLKSIGVTHIIYHWYIGTETVMFPAPIAPGFGTLSVDGFTPNEVEGLNIIWESDKLPFRDYLSGPHDYDYAVLYEIEGNDR